MTKFLLIYLFTLSSLSSQSVEIHGAIKNMMHGDLHATYDMQNLEKEKHTYGIGALENLKGEILLLDGKPFISRVNGENTAIDTSFNNKAAFLAFAQIDQWRAEGTLQEGLGFSDLDSILSKKMTKNKGSLIFQIEGTVKSLTWHVINWADGDTVHTYKKHKASGLHGTIQDEPVTILGFYSQNHRGILTHKNSNLHLHFLTADKRLAGHIDDLVLRKGVLKIGVE